MLRGLAAAAAVVARPALQDVAVAATVALPARCFAAAAATNGSGGGGTSSVGASAAPVGVREIKLHTKEKVLEVVFDDGVTRRFSAELLRVSSLISTLYVPVR